MKNRKNDVPPPPFVKQTFPRASEPSIRVTQTIRESLPLDTVSHIATMSLQDKQELLARYNQQAFSLHTQYVETIAIRDALALDVQTALNVPHWVRHAAVATLHGSGPRLMPCAKCGRSTQWSFDGRPQCTIFRDMVPTAPEHAVCMVETGTRKWVTTQERDVANILQAYGVEKKSPTKKGKK